MSNAPAPQPDLGAPGPNVAYSAPAPPQGPMPPHPHPQQPWANPYGPGWSGGSPVLDGPKGFGLAVAAVVLGLLGWCLPFLPMDLTGVRPYIGLPFGLAGFVAAVVGCTGRHRAKPLAVVGAILSVLALLLAMTMMAGYV